MITREDDVGAHALHRRGWTISATARHLGHDRKTIRAYLNGERVAWERKRSDQDPLEPFVGYCRERLAEDPHLCASTLVDELLELGFDRSYPTLTPALRAKALRTPYEACRPTKGRPSSLIEHPPGAEALCGVPYKPSYCDDAGLAPPREARRPPVASAFRPCGEDDASRSCPVQPVRWRRAPPRPPRPG